MYTELKEQLEKYKDIVFYYGLTEDKISVIEEQMENKFPIYFREFLKIFGVRQDFVFGLLDKEKSFVEKMSYLPDNIKKSFVIIGDNGGEDYWLLNSENENDKSIYEWKYWDDGEIEKLNFNFDTLLKRSLIRLSDTTVNRKINNNKLWCVQFAIPAKNQQDICSVIPLTISDEWKLIEVSPAEVYCYETIALLNGTEIKLKRQEYSGWENPIYYFDLKEPLSNFGKESLIEELDNKLKQQFSEYRLGDYGIL